MGIVGKWWLWTGLTVLSMSWDSASGILCRWEKVIHRGLNVMAGHGSCQIYPSHLQNLGHYTMHTQWQIPSSLHVLKKKTRRGSSSFSRLGTDYHLSIAPCPITNWVFWVRVQFSSYVAGQLSAISWQSLETSWWLRPSDLWAMAERTWPWRVWTWPISGGPKWAIFFDQDPDREAANPTRNDACFSQRIASARGLTVVQKGRHKSNDSERFVAHFNHPTWDPDILSLPLPKLLYNVMHDANMCWIVVQSTWKNPLEIKPRLKQPCKKKKLFQAYLLQPTKLQ